MAACNRLDGSGRGRAKIKYHLAPFLIVPGKVRERPPVTTPACLAILASDNVLFHQQELFRSRIKGSRQELCVAVRHKGTDRQLYLGFARSRRR
jgi:hypothetical protein